MEGDWLPLGFGNDVADPEAANVDPVVEPIVVIFDGVELGATTAATAPATWFVPVT